MRRDDHPEPAEACTELMGADDARDPMTTEDLALLVVVVVGCLAATCVIVWGVFTLAMR